jgi:hypothetical protein
MWLLRRHRRWACSGLVALLLFMQWATATYACPRLETAGPDGAAAAVAAMPGCSGDMAGMDPAQPQLCKAHCDAGQQSVNSGAAALDAPPVMAVAGAIVRVLAVDSLVRLAAAMPPAGTAAGPPAGTPPLYLSLLALRN